MLAYLNLNLFNKSSNISKMHGCEGKKTALLQTLDVRRLARFVPMGYRDAVFVRGVLFSLMRPKGAKSVGEKN
jgi:hypothetical protein